MRKRWLFPTHTKLWCVLALGLVEGVQGRPQVVEAGLGASGIERITYCTSLGIRKPSVGSFLAPPGARGLASGLTFSWSHSCPLFFPPWAQMRQS